MATTRKTIPVPMKDAVWANRNGKSTDGKCYVCDKPITRSTMECGHIVAVKNGGINYVDNLEPICSSCNRSMGTMNLLDFKKMVVAKCAKPMDLSEADGAVCRALQRQLAECQLKLFEYERTYQARVYALEKREWELRQYETQLRTREAALVAARTRAQ